MQKSPKSLNRFIFFIFIAFYQSTVGFGNDSSDENIVFLEKKVREIIPAYRFDRIQKSPIDNIYEIIFGSEIIYITSDAKFIFEGGNLQKVIKENDSYVFENLTKKLSLLGRKNILDKISDSELFIYGKGNKYINVITDIDCPYCQKFHNDISVYKNFNIKVRYIVIANKDDLKNRLVSAWCSVDRNKSFSLLKKGKKIPKKDCDNPIEQHQIYVNSLGVNSTPSIFLSDGTLILGYETPENVIEKMKN